jgi:hypothetical protein
MGANPILFRIQYRESSQNNHSGSIDSTNRSNHRTDAQPQAQGRPHEPLLVCGNLNCRSSVLIQKLSDQLMERISGLGILRNCREFTVSVKC